MRTYGTKHGTYTPINVDKYCGRSLPIYRSGWELKAFISLDKNPKIKKWGSETLSIPYIDTTRNKETHWYIPDLFFSVIDVNGIERKWLIEIKPYNQSVIPKASKRKSPQKLLLEQLIVQRNHDKWNATIQFCKNKGWSFGIMTEKGIEQLC